MLIKLLCFRVLLVIVSVSANISLILKELQERKELAMVMIDLLNMAMRRHDVTCVAIITDPVYLNVFDGAFFTETYSVPVVMTVVEENEDLLSPNFDTLESLRQGRKDGCNMYLILLANALQTSRLLTFGDRYRILDTRAIYIMLHDIRLFHSDLHYLWKRVINVIFLRYHKKLAGVLKSKDWFDLSTVPFPNPIKSVMVTRRVDIWKNGKFHYNRSLFSDKTKNLNAQFINVVYLDHVPSVVVVKSNETNKIGGVEIEILHTLADKMNFKPKLYQPPNAELYKWGQKQSNGSFNGLLGEMLDGNADMALGNLQYTPYHRELTDLSIPYTSQCWTFLTPESLSDNSWKTLILPFKLYMWIAVLLMLFVTGSIFYGLARYYIYLLKYKRDVNEKRNSGYTKNSKEKGDELYSEKPVGLYLFGEIINSILYTYGMLLVVSLPKLPTGWSIRLLTGWYWLYCILLVVSYRASMTAILANPIPRVTIDTLQELVDSKITSSGWGSETKKFFEESLDDVVQKIGKRFETIDDPNEAVNKVSEGVNAYYENIHFLKYLSVKRKNAYMDNNTINSTNVTEITVRTGPERNLHIMTDCVVHIPISIGFHKNSPLKPLADLYIRRIVEVGLVEKWLNDAMYKIRSLERNDEEVKALMNLKKLYGAFVALGIGYLLSTVFLLSELIYWHLIVQKDPNFDKYAIDVYYKNKNKKQ